MAIGEVVLRQAHETDIPALAALEESAFAVPNWPADAFLRYDCIVAEVSGQVVGFLVSRQIYPGNDSAPPEREILNLAVAPECRRTGIASRLMQLEFLKKSTFLLEVRESNLAARSLYERLGFAEISRRRDYYDNPRETAIVMQMK